MKLAVKMLMRRLNELELAEPLRAACKPHFATLEEVLSEGRDPAVSAARRACFAVLSGEPYMIHPSRVGRLMGVDPSTVAYGLKSPDERAARDAKTKVRDAAKPDPEPKSGKRARKRVAS